MVNSPDEMCLRVIASQAYQDRREGLQELLRLSRVADRDPHGLLAIQEGIRFLLAEWQNQKSKFKQEDDEVGIAIVKRLMLNLKSIADSIVWRVLDYDRVFIQLMAEHQQTGALDGTTLDDLHQAALLVEKEGVIALVNDLTSVLRHGDITLIHPNTKPLVVESIEMKYGKSAQKSGRSKRQRRRAEAMSEFWNTGTRVVEGVNHYVHNSPVTFKTYHEALRRVLTQARETGIAQEQVSDCIAIEALRLTWPHTRPTPTQTRPFQGSRGGVLRLHNLQVWEHPLSRVAPYGIFPISDEDRIDLMTGEVLLVVSLHTDALYHHFSKFGLELRWPMPTEAEIATYMSASIAERKKRASESRIEVISDISSFFPSLDLLLSPLLLELVHEDTLAESIQQLIEAASHVREAGDEPQRYYIRYEEGHGVWD